MPRVTDRKGATHLSCSSCLRVYPVAEFRLRGRKCSGCRYLKHRRRYEANHERIVQQARDRRACAKAREKENAQARERYRRNPDSPRRSGWIVRDVQLRHGIIFEDFSKHEIFIRDKGKCQYCQCDLPERGWHLDHVLPLSRGGNHLRSNVVASCAKCNLSKGNKLIFPPNVTKLAAVG